MCFHAIEYASGPRTGKQILAVRFSEHPRSPQIVQEETNGTLKGGARPAIIIGSDFGKSFQKSNALLSFERPSVVLARTLGCISVQCRN